MRFNPFYVRYCVCEGRITDLYDTISVLHAAKGAGKNMNTIREQYPYLYETHLHTSESSACAVSLGADMARACKEYGYAGIFVTDHNWGGNTATDRNLSWDG